MFKIEPCCTQKHLLEIRNAIGKNGTTLFEGYGDMSITELLHALLTRYGETEMMIVAPAIPDQAAEAISKAMKRQFARMDGKGKLDVLQHLTILADLTKKSSPEASSWLKDNPFEGRLTLVSIKQQEHVILLPDIAIIGFTNMQYSAHFIATATAKPATVAALWARFRQLVSDEQQKKEAAEAAKAARKEAAAEEKTPEVKEENAVAEDAQETMS